MATYQIKIDREGCISCGVCYTLAPARFELDDAGKAQVIGGETNTPTSCGVFENDEIYAVQEAEGLCPTSVITVTVRERTENNLSKKIRC